MYAVNSNNSPTWRFDDKQPPSMPALLAFFGSFF